VCSVEEIEAHNHFGILKACKAVALTWPTRRRPWAPRRSANMQASQVYVVERVYEDLRPSFVAKDAIKQLSQLDAVVGDVFNRLAHKLAQEKERVAAVDARIRVAQAKVNALTARRTSNKPTTVFSTSKYPAPKGTLGSLEVMLVPQTTDGVLLLIASAPDEQDAVP
jgi:hypothetical protein